MSRLSEGAVWIESCVPICYFCGKPYPSTKASIQAVKVIRLIDRSASRGLTGCACNARCPALPRARGNARKAFLESFERAVDPDLVLPVDERRRRAEYARKAHFARLARLSAIARGTRRPDGKLDA